MASEGVQTALSGLADEARRVSGSESSFAGIRTIGDVGRKFGLSKDLTSVYAPLRAILAGQSARRKRAASFMGGRSSVPGMTTAAADAQENEQLMQLLSGQAQGELQQGNFMANLLQGSMGAADQFGLNRGQIAGSLYSQGGNLQLQSDQLDYESEDAGLMDFLGSFLGPAAQIATAALLPGSGTTSLIGGLLNGGGGGNRNTAPTAPPRRAGSGTPNAGTP